MIVVRDLTVFIHAHDQPLAKARVLEFEQTY